MRIVSWLDGLGGASLDQIRRRFGLGRTQGYRRVQVLHDYGLVRWLHPLVGVPALYVTGKRGVRPWAFEHALAVVDVVVDLELDGRTVLGEVAIRRARKDASSAGGSLLTTEQLDVIEASRRIPDAIELRPDGGLVAYEIEIASKGRARRDQILLSYSASDFTAVEWLLPEPQLARLVRRAIADMGLDDFMRVTQARRIALPRSPTRPHNARPRRSSDERAAHG